MMPSLPDLKRTRRAGSWLVVLLLVAGTVVIGRPAFALDDVLEGSPVRRRHLQFREGRHEVAGLVGMTVGDPYVRNILPGARYDFHFYDWLSFGAHVHAGIPVQTAYFSEIDAKVGANNDTFAMEASRIQFLALAHVSVSPLVGKLLVANGSTPVRFDIHFDLLAGMAGVGSTGEALETGTSLSLGAAGGFRVYLSKVLAVTTNLQALTINRPLSVNRDSKEVGGKLRFNTVFNVGVSFFMPPEIRRAK